MVEDESLQEPLVSWKKWPSFRWAISPTCLPTMDYRSGKYLGITDSGVMTYGNRPYDHDRRKDPLISVGWDY